MSSRIWNRKVQRRGHRCPSVVPILCHVLVSYPFNLRFNIILPLRPCKFTLLVAGVLPRRSGFNPRTQGQSIWDLLWTKWHCVGFEVFTAVVLKSIFFWDIESCPFQGLPLRCCAKTTMFLGGLFQDHTLRSCFPICPMI
jgi:hypothetical protein